MDREGEEGGVFLISEKIIGSDGHPPDDQFYLIIKQILFILEALKGIGLSQTQFWCWLEGFLLCKTPKNVAIVSLTLQPRQ